MEPTIDEVMSDLDTYFERHVDERKFYGLTDDYQRPLPSSPDYSLSIVGNSRNCLLIRNKEGNKAFVFLREPLFTGYPKLVVVHSDLDYSAKERHQTLDYRKLNHRTLYSRDLFIEAPTPEISTPMERLDFGRNVAVGVAAGNRINIRTSCKEVLTGAHSAILDGTLPWWRMSVFFEREPGYHTKMHCLPDGRFPEEPKGFLSNLRK